MSHEPDSYLNEDMLTPKSLSGAYRRRVTSFNFLPQRGLYPTIWD